ncbi:hypothetical protein LSCM1_06927 [Leishmania martiniquensis]|uniref:Uncharacterized protein n=1 Tax=Leishmania martiniquensis TaxID=1580590 RepID=A0A836HRI8_9TRYP|nr:hypothetical protein LSCM1_06927 [Leishmania martiniquensis]
MMRLSALSRAARKSAGVHIAATVGRKPSLHKATTKKPKAKKRCPSARVTPRRRRVSPGSHTRSVSEAAQRRALAAPMRGITVDEARASARVGGLHKVGDETKLVTPAVQLTRGGQAMRASSPDSRASASPPFSPLPLPSSALPSSSPSLPPPVVPHVDGRGVSVATLQPRIRSLLAQLILLSPEPLRPSLLFARYRSVVDEQTASMCAWAAHAVYLYDHGLQQRGPCVGSHAASRKASGGGGGARDATQHSASRAEDKAGEEGSSEGAIAAAEERLLWHRGLQLSQAYRESVVPLVAALCGGGGSGETETSVTSRLPESHEVEQWMFLSIIFSDAEFRVSPYSGAVSYPALPSLLMATVDPVRDREVAKLCYALQWGAQAKAAAHAAFHEAHTTGGAKYLSGSAGGTREQQTHAPPAAARKQAVTSHSNFVWLDGAAGSPTWTTAHAQYLLHSALAGGRKSSEGPATGLATCAAGSSADPQLRKAIAALAGLPHTSGHPLVDVMLQASSVAGVVAYNGSPQRSKADVRMSECGTAASTTRGAAAAAAAPPALGWNEGTKGTDAAVSFATDAGEGGLFATMMGDLPTRSLSDSAMHEVNRRLIAHLFRKLVAIPISVARLSAVVRWNLSVTHATHYRSFLYFLLLTAANPMVRRMAEGRRHRRRANAVCADVWGRGKGDEGEVRGGMEAEVRHALAQYDPRTYGGLQGSGSTSEGRVVAALRRAFIADADVTDKCERAAHAVMEVMCVRILPHARPGRRSTDAPVTSSSFCGYPLRFVEVLPTWHRTPEEVLEHLWRRQDEEQLSRAGANWLENEEPYITVFSLDRGVLDARLRLVVDRYLDLTNGDDAPPNSAASRRVTLHQLGLMTLWAHEYGAEMAAELLFVHLLPRHEEVRLYPPSGSGHERRSEEAQQRAATVIGDGTSTDSGYGAWTAEFPQ